MAKGPTGVTPSMSVPEQIWQALLRAGASPVQAAGIMGNAISESSLNPEVIAAGGPQNGVGLFQWETTFYPNVPMPTGDKARDIRDQVNFLVQTGGLHAASGTTVSETAGNFASRYERCRGCQQGGSQYDTRVAQAGTVANWAASGSWPASKGQASSTATLTASQTAEELQQQKICAWGIGFPGIDPAVPFTHYHPYGTILKFNICLLYKSQARALLGSLLLGGGIVIMFGGVQLMAVAAALDVVQKLTGGGRIAIIPSIGQGLRRPPAGAGSPSSGGPPAAPAAAGDAVAATA